MIQRNTSEVDGVLVATDRVEGYLDAELDQRILEASTWWLEMETEPPEPDPERSHSYFIFQRIDDDAACAEVLAAADSMR